jgi:putative holliday junction resolvase
LRLRGPLLKIRPLLVSHLIMDAYYLAFDFGLRRIGVACGQTVTKTASCLAILLAKDGAPDWHQVTTLIRKWSPAALIVGIPLHLDGSVQELTARAENFALELEQRYGIPVHRVDERLTTKDARAGLYSAGGYKALKTEPIDSYAAKLMLEAWLRDQPCAVDSCG